MSCFGLAGGERRHARVNSLGRPSGELHRVPGKKKAATSPQVAVSNGHLVVPGLWPKGPHPRFGGRHLGLSVPGCRARARASPDGEIDHTTVCRNRRGVPGHRMASLASRHLRRTAHLPSRQDIPKEHRDGAGTMWRAVPGGAGSGRCAARATAVSFSRILAGQAPLPLRPPARPASQLGLPTPGQLQRSVEDDCPLRLAATTEKTRPALKGQRAVRASNHGVQMGVSGLSEVVNGFFRWRAWRILWPAASPLGRQGPWKTRWARGELWAGQPFRKLHLRRVATPRAVRVRAPRTPPNHPRRGTATPIDWRWSSGFSG